MSQPVNTDNWKRARASKALAVYTMTGPAMGAKLNPDMLSISKCDYLLLLNAEFF